MGGFRLGVIWDTGPFEDEIEDGAREQVHRKQTALTSQGNRRPSISHNYAEVGMGGLSIVGHYAHFLPRWVTLLMAVLVGVIMVCCAWIMNQCDLVFVLKKFQASQWLLTNVSWVLSLLFLWIASAVLSCFAALLVLYVHPGAMGSGLPELKGYANGDRIDGLYGRCGNWVRGAGAVLAQGAGFPTGREGPIVSLGGSVGVALARIITQPFYKVWIDKDVEEHDQESLDMDLKSYAQSKRLGCMMGGAAALTAVFNAPIGATLYILEEVTVSAWTAQTTFFVLAAAITSKILMRIMVRLNGEEIHSIIVYRNVGEGFGHGHAHKTYDWSFGDIPFFVLVGIVGGILGALYSKGSIRVWIWRNKSAQCRCRRKSKRIKVLEVVGLAILCMTLLFTAPLLVRCSHALIEGLEERIFVKHFCSCAQEEQTKKLEKLEAEGQLQAGELLKSRAETVFEDQFCGMDGKAAPLEIESDDDNSTTPKRPTDFNVLATFLLQGSEGAIKQLYSRDYHVGEELKSLVICFIVYFTLALTIAGIPVPMGTFIPNMFMGAVAGRMIPKLVQLVVPEASTWMADPGLYAVAGSAAMLSGFTHMTIAIAGLLVEVTLDLYLSGPILIAAIFGRLFGQLVQHHDYNEALILLKGVPYLDPDCPTKVHELGLTLGECADVVPEAGKLPLEASRATIRKALRLRPKLPYFPLLDREGSNCIGLIPRSRLERVLMQHPGVDPADLQDVGPSEDSGDEEHGGETEEGKAHDDNDKMFDILHPYFEEDKELEIGVGPEFESDPVPLLPISATMTHSIPEDTLVAHIWPLFSRLNIDKVCVLSQVSSATPLATAPPASSLLGILDRRHLVRLAEKYAH